jgi:hypothetical protein
MSLKKGLDYLPQEFLNEKRVAEWTNCDKERKVYMNTKM